MQTGKTENTLYDQLMQLPETLVGEIIDGRLYTQHLSTGPQAAAISSLAIQIGPPYHLGRDGPGDWWLLQKPELHFVRDTQVLVPDIAGWRRKRISTFPQDQRFEVAPDWVCEVFAPSTAKKDRVTKMPVYARYGVPYLWLVDPLAHTLEAYTLESGHWLMHGVYSDETEVRIPPFTDIALVLTDLWVET